MFSSEPERCMEEGGRLTMYGRVGLGDEALRDDERVA
jgi:hypothetical protein